MTAKKTTKGKGLGTKLKLKKETLKELDAGKTAKGVKGGMRPAGDDHTKMIGGCTIFRVCV
jgi:hypothetical protein